MSFRPVVPVLALLTLLPSCLLSRTPPPESKPQLSASGSWSPRGSIQLCIDDTFGSHGPDITALVTQASTEWTQYGQISYVQRPCDGRQDITVTMTTDPNEARGSAHIPSGPDSKVVLTLKLVEGRGQLLWFGRLRKERTYGVLLHEIGHTLGFTHEHELQRGTEITPQDPRSVMYYPFEPGSWHQAGWDDGWDQARLSWSDKLGMMTHYPPAVLSSPVPSSPPAILEGAAHCPEGSVLNGIACEGRYCGRLKLSCVRPRTAAKPVRQATLGPTPPSNPALVSSPELFVTGLGCLGPHCAQVTLTSSAFPQLAPSTNCYDSPPFSEEPGPQGQNDHHVCKKDHGITGLRCMGSYCDQLSVRCCAVR